MAFHKTGRRNSRTLLFFVNSAIVIENDWVGEREYCILKAGHFVLSVTQKDLGQLLMVFYCRENKASMKNQYTFPDPISY